MQRETWIQSPILHSIKYYIITYHTKSLDHILVLYSVTQYDHDLLVMISKVVQQILSTI